METLWDKGPWQFFEEYEERFVNNRKRESQKHTAYPQTISNLPFLQGQPFTIASSGRLFSILEDLITKTNKSDNEDTCLY